MCTSLVPCFKGSVQQNLEDMGHLSPLIKFLGRILLNKSIDSFHIVNSLSNRSSIEKSIKLIFKMKGQIAF